MSDDVFVQRTFDVDEHPVACRFFHPEPDGNDFTCQCEIDWPAGARSYRAYGVDGVQALLLAMERARVELLVTREDDRRAVTWLGQSRLNLPIPETVRDLER